MDVLTPPGLAGVAVVAFGPGERDAALACLATRSGRAFALATPARPQLAALRLDGAVVDEVLVVDRGERGLELHLHGSPAVVAALQQRFPLSAAPLAPRAALLAAAVGTAQLDLALEQLACDFAPLLAAARADAAVARAALDRSRIVLAHREPCRAVLVGAQNAGKSTLFNALLGRERALTGPLPGLTRDPVQDLGLLAGYPYELVDTAGEGETAQAIDALAVARGRALRGGALVVLVVDHNRGPGAVDRALLAAHPDAVVVASKADLLPAPWPADVRRDLVVACTPAAGAAAARAVGELLRHRRELPPAGPVGGGAACDRAELAALQACAHGC